MTQHASIPAESADSGPAAAGGYDPERDPEILALRKRAAQAEIDAAAKSEPLKKDHELALVKGQSPEQIEARKRVVRLFFELHLPDETPDAVEAFLQRVDCTQPLVSMNARGIDVQNPKARGFLGLGRKPAYLLSKRYAPAQDTDPLHALEYYPAQA
jgi:hypothetical protein